MFDGFVKSPISALEQRVNPCKGLGEIFCVSANPPIIGTCSQIE